MNRLDVIRKIAPHTLALREAGLKSLYLFGSTARDQASELSDVDLFFDLDQKKSFTLFDLAALQETLEAIVEARVDLMSRQGIHPRKKDRIVQSAYQIF